MTTKKTHRLRRACFKLLPKAALAKCPDWGFLRHYPAQSPSTSLLQRWNHSHWEEYQRWLTQHSLQNAAAWQTLQHVYRHWHNPPKISLVTPVYNTEPSVLQECILSVKLQAYPYWQWILIDDASTRTDTKQVLASALCDDPRIRIIFAASNQGIAKATNQALTKATGDFVVFLDHDDRLSLDALGELALAIRQDQDVDILYSDRDMISEAGERYLHLFKPAWSPETLLSGNYLFHLACYRRTLLQTLQGLRAEYDGSQDYDLILRAAELQPKVGHIPKILYHWRQHGASVALNAHAKDYAFAAGLRALNDALARRGIHGSAREIPDFWRGTYELALPLPAEESLHIVNVLPDDRDKHYATIIKQAMATSAASKSYLVILSASITPETDDTIRRLAAWLMNVDGVALASAKVVNDDDTLDYVGMAYNRDTSLMHPYRGWPHTEAGYMAVSQIIRNISAPHPLCVVVSKSWWHTLQGFDPHLQGPLALLDFALRAQAQGGRSVIVPQCIFRQAGHAFIAPQTGADASYFKHRWQPYLQHGDPYYNPNLAEHSADMGLGI